MTSVKRCRNGNGLGLNTEDGSPNVSADPNKNGKMQGSTINYEDGIKAPSSDCSTTELLSPKFPKPLKSLEEHPG